MVARHASARNCHRLQLPRQGSAECSGDWPDGLAAAAGASPPHRPRSLHSSVGGWRRLGARTADRQCRDQNRGCGRMNRAKARRHEAPRLAQGPSRDRQDVAGNPGGRVHHQPRGRRRAGERHRFERACERCCPTCRARSRSIRRSPVALPTVPATCANVATPLPDAVLMPSFRHKRTPSSGSRTPSGPPGPVLGPRADKAYTRNEILRTAKRAGRTVWRRRSRGHCRGRAKI